MKKFEPSWLFISVVFIVAGCMWSFLVTHVLPFGGRSLGENPSSWPKELAFPAFVSAVYCIWHFVHDFREIGAQAKRHGVAAPHETCKEKLAKEYVYAKRANESNASEMAFFSSILVLSAVVVSGGFAGLHGLLYVCSRMLYAVFLRKTDEIDVVQFSLPAHLMMGIMSGTTLIHGIRIMIFL